MRTIFRLKRSPDASMKNTRNTTATTAAAASATLLPPVHTMPQNDGGGDGGAATADDGALLPVCAIDSISAAAFFTSATGLACLPLALLSDVAIERAASGTR